MEININSPVFNAMLMDLNSEIQRTLNKVYEEEFESGGINLKLNIVILEDEKEFPKEDELGNDTSEIYRYKKPHFQHKITTNLKQQFKREGAYFEDKEIKRKDDTYYVEPIKDPQLSFLD